MKGFFISFEGGEGAGKSVQAELLVNKLRSEGYTVVVTREPGGTRIGEHIRSITHDPENVDLTPIAEAYLMAGSRAQHVREIIIPSLEAGKIVVCDRYIDSSLAYQGYGRNLGVEKISALNDLAINGTLPDMTILLNISVDMGLERREHAAKANDRLDLQQKDFYQRVTQGYLDLAKKFTNRYVVIDGTLSVPDVSSNVWNAVKEKLPKRDA